MTRQRMGAEQRKLEILDAAVTCALGGGFERVTREWVAATAGCSPALVSYHFQDQAGLMDAVMVEAVVRPVLRILAEGLASKHPVALDAPEELRVAAARALVSG